MPKRIFIIEVESEGFDFASRGYLPSSDFMHTARGVIEQAMPETKITFVYEQGNKRGGLIATDR